MKRLLIGAMLLGAAMVSCSESGDLDGMTPGSPNEANTVRLNTAVTATRGEDVTSLSLQNNGKVFLVCMPHSLPEGNFAASEYTYDNTNGSWSANDENFTWANIGFPASFFSVHDGESTFNNFNSYSGKWDHTARTRTVYYTSPAGESTATKDLVYFAQKVESMPVGGAITALHKHALSKINFTTTAGTGEKVYIADVKLKNVATKGDLTLKTVDGTAEWDNQTTSGSYNYFAATPTANGSLQTNNNALLMIPQTTEAHEPLASTSTETYIEVLYYMVDANGRAIVGFPKAADCTLDSITADAAESGLGENEPIYMKVAFPMAYTFEMGTQYDITLNFNSKTSTGGYVIAPSYFQADGTAIDLKDERGAYMLFPKSINDPAITGASSKIGLYITPASWGDETPVTPEGDKTLGTKNEPFEISTYSDFMEMANPEYAKVYCELANDIDFTGVTDYTPFELNGVLDGKGYSITNLTISKHVEDADGAGYIGLFSKVGVDSTVKNLELDDNTVKFKFDSATPTKDPLYIGSFAGVNYGTIESCTAGTGNTYTYNLDMNFGNTETIINNICIGGIAGAMMGDGSPKITDCTTYTYIIINSWDSSSGKAGTIAGKVDSENATVKNNSGKLSLGPFPGSVVFNFSQPAVGNFDTGITIIGLNDGTDTNDCTITGISQGV